MEIIGGDSSHGEEVERFIGTKIDRNLLEESHDVVRFPSLVAEGLRNASKNIRLEADFILEVGYFMRVDCRDLEKQESKSKKMHNQTYRLNPTHCCNHLSIA